ncbi:MAG: Spy/CpxP family protein refolding chaperone, partial [Acidobacteriota bacterium]|nr:Spy/CpxP family protein refolding chaperone [Acidobacteriota bacterium]
MHKIKKATITSLALSALVMLGQFTMAQTTQTTQTPQQSSGAGTGSGAGMGRGGGQGGQQLARILDELNLTEEQKGKAKTVLDDQAKQMKAVREDSSLAREDRQAKMRDIRQATMKQIKEMLTPEQQKKMDELQQKAREKAPSSTSTGSQPTP